MAWLLLSKGRNMKNQLAVFGLFGFTLLMGWLIWGVGGYWGTLALGYMIGAFSMIVAGIWLTKGKT